MERDDVVRWRARVLATLDHVGAELDARHVIPAGDLSLAFESLRELITHGRRPRIAVVGRRGAAKSSLLNALANEPRAELGDVEDATRIVRWSALGWGVSEVLFADTPGLRASGRMRRLDDVTRALVFSPPDIVLVLCHSTEVDAGIDEDLSDVKVILEALGRETGHSPQVAAAVTRIDELDPPEILHPPFDDPEKQRNIVRATNVLRAHLMRHGIEPITVVPIATYVRFEGGEVRDDLRWNLDCLVHELSVWLPDPLERNEFAGQEIRALLGIAMNALTEVLAREPGKPNVGADRDALTRELLVRWLRGLAPYPSRGGQTLDVAVNGAVALRWASDAFSALGARRWSAAVASARIRALGHALRDRLLARVDAADFAGLANEVGAMASDAR